MVIVLPEWRNWQTRQVEGLVPFTGSAGSIPVSGTYSTRACVNKAQALLHAPGRNRAQNGRRHDRLRAIRVALASLVEKRVPALQCAAASRRHAWAGCIKTRIPSTSRSASASADRSEEH